jgi:hypothetical protein
MVYRTHRKQFPSWGPTITTSTVHRGSNKGSGGDGWFMIQDGGYAQELDRLTGLLRASVWAGRNRYEKDGRGTLGRRAEGKPPEQPEPALKDADFLVSPVDGTLAAIRDGNLKIAVPKQLGVEWSKIREELAPPVLSPIVDRTIEEALTEKLRRTFLTGWLPPKGRLFQGIVRCLKPLPYLLLSKKKALAEDALQALVDGGGQSPKEVASRLLGYSPERAEHRMMLLAMGRDQAVGRLAYDDAHDKLRADLDLYRLAPLYMDEELSMRDVARALGGELRVNPAWSFLGKPITVHSHGGCPMSDDPEDGVTTPDGEVHGWKGLYVLDGSILCSSVGVNPSPTIAAVAERNIDRFLKKELRHEWPNAEYKEQVADAKRWYDKAVEAQWSLSPPDRGPGPSSEPVGIAFDEIMQGFWSKPNGDPQYNDAEYRRLENEGRPEEPVTLKLTASVRNLAAFFEALSHELKIGESESGPSTISLRVPGTELRKSYNVTGTLQLFVEGKGKPEVGKYRYKPYGLDRDNPFEKEAVDALIKRMSGRGYTDDYTTTSTKPDGHPEQRFMFYDLAFQDGQGKRWKVNGYKRLRDTAALDAWRDATSLFLKLTADGEPPEAPPALAGVVHVELVDFLKQLRSTRVVTWDRLDKLTEEDPTLHDPLRTAWAVGTFGTFFFGTLQRIYLPQLTPVLGTVGRVPHKRPSSVQP